MIDVGELVKTPGETWVAHGLLVYLAVVLGRLFGAVAGDPLVWGLVLGSLATAAYVAKELLERSASRRLERTAGRAARHDGVGDLVLPLFVWALAALAPLHALGFWLAGVAAAGWLGGQLYYRGGS